MEPWVLSIMGPTASGKTHLSVLLAAHFGGEVVSTDARQFYSEMQIGTAKPTQQEMKGVVHHFIDSHSIHDPLSAGAYEREAMPILENILASGKLPVLVGGSGLYIKALLEGLDDLPSSKEVRLQLYDRLEKQGLRQLQLDLQKADPEYYADADIHNPVRVIRALELNILTGKKMYELQRGEAMPRPFHVLKIGISIDREELYRRIDRRVDQMVNAGLVAEVKGLMPYRNMQALQTVGYKEVFDYLDGSTSWEETVQLLKRNTRRYAKRQMTWLRRDAQIHWFPKEAEQKIVDFVTKTIGRKP